VIGTGSPVPQAQEVFDRPDPEVVTRQHYPGLGLGSESGEHLLLVGLQLLHDRGQPARPAHQESVAVSLDPEPLSPGSSEEL
jgi:hypothetical protein